MGFQVRHWQRRSPGAPLAAAQRRGLSVGQVQDADLPTLLDQLDDRAAHSQLGVIRMRSHDERVERALLLARCCPWVSQGQQCSSFGTFQRIICRNKPPVWAQ